MTALDHSSVIALLYDLNRHRDDGLFRFRYHSDNSTSPPWRLKSAFANGSNGGVQLRVEYAPSGTADDFSVRLDGGFLVSGGSVPFGIIVVEIRRSGPPCGGSSDSSADNSQRDQLDKNLRGVFA